MKKVIAASALSMLTAGCLTVPERLAQQRPATAAEKASIVAGARDVMKDPYSIRDAEISQFVPATSGPDGNICVRANAKNGFGAYTGRTNWLIAVSGGKAVNAWEGHAHCAHPQIKWQPFPEIYALQKL